MDFPLIDYFTDDLKIPGLNKTWGEIKASLRNRLLELPIATKRFVEKCAKNGWFVSEEFDQFGLAQLVDKDDAFIESVLINTYRTNIQSILEKLRTSFPYRALLIQSAFEAHNQGNYNASIPLMLAQAEGICQDKYGVKLFSTKNGVPLTKEKVENQLKSKGYIGGVIEAVVEPLISGSALMLNNSEMFNKRTADPNYNVLNRHEILHGVDKNYGNEINSLRAISLLSYLAILNKL
jgi:hypothetical protein